MKSKALTRDERKRQILLAFAVNLQAGGDGRMTVADIARKLQLSPSQKLRDMVKELEIEGLLVGQAEPMPGVVGKRVIYSPTPIFDMRHGTKHHEPRTIEIRAKKNGQLVLWTEVVS